MSLKQRFYKESRNKNIFEKTYEKLTRIPYNNMITDQYMKFLEENTEMNFESVLDIGCRYGTLVKSFKNMGICAKGIEADQYFIHHKVTNEIEWNYFDEDYTTDKKYDLIIFGQCIYYMDNPLQKISIAKSILTDKGMIFISTGLNLEEKLKVENYINYIKQLKMKIVKVQRYDSNFTIGVLKGKNKIIQMIKYSLRLKKDYVKQPSGIITFLLFKNEVN